MKYAALICFMLLTSGCDLFRTRDPQTPTQSRSNFQPPVTHDIPIQNLRNSMLDQNLQNYLDCFVDSLYASKSYIFTPSSVAASLYPVFNNWDKSSESQYFTNLKSALFSGLQMVINLTVTDSSKQGESWIYSASYSLDFPFMDATLPSHYEGQLKFNIILEESRNIWCIYQWQDIKSSSALSWSDLKGRLYNH